MDARRFDTLVRSLGAPSHRRGVLRALASLGMTIGWLGLADDEGTARRKGRGRRRSHRPGKRKDNRKGKRGGGGVGSGDACRSDSACAQGETCCGGACVNLQTDSAHCGSCGNACTVPSQACMDGSCQCATIICTGSGCCPSQNDVCNQNDECCSPKTCADYPAGTCGPQDNGCGGTTPCPCCPGTPCDCPPGRTLCDDFTGPKVFCTDSSCLCVEDVAGESLCYSGGTCYQDLAICATDDDCQSQFPGFRCVKAGACGLGCLQTACVAPCSPDAPDVPPPITVLPAP